MATNFRSSFNGFNRDDVVHYLDYLNKKHDEMLSQLSTEADNLRQKLEKAMQTDSGEVETLKQQCSQLESSLADMESEKTALEGQVAELQEKLEQSHEENLALEGKISDLQAELNSTREALRQVQTDRDADKNRFSATQSRQELELEAYRRAERAERMARERAEQVYRQTNGVLADATVKVEETANQIANISDHVMSQLDLLRSAVDGSKQALADAAAGLYILKPKNE